MISSVGWLKKNDVDNWMANRMDDVYSLHVEIDYH